MNGRALRKRGQAFGDRPSTPDAVQALLHQFPEIASRLFISRNTVKAEAIAVYRKLGAASRSGAIERAVEVGLLETSIYPSGPEFTQ